MLSANDKTHTERKKPQVTARALADYMAASEQARRRIIRDCKYRATARVIQHGDARKIVADFLADSTHNMDLLKKRLGQLQARICDSVFEHDSNQHNCDYVTTFVDVWGWLQLPEATYTKESATYAVDLNGTRVSFAPDLLAMRITTRNTVKRGAVSLRYAKKKSLSSEVAAFQSAFSFRFLKENPIHDEGEPERGLCLTVDVSTGAIYEAPTDSAYRYKEMAAVCEAIAERWDRIKPPPGAVL